MLVASLCNISISLVITGGPTDYRSLGQAGAGGSTGGAAHRPGGGARAGLWDPSLAGLQKTILAQAHRAGRGGASWQAGQAPGRAEFSALQCGLKLVSAVPGPGEPPQLCQLDSDKVRSRVSAAAVVNDRSRRYYYAVLV